MNKLFFALALLFVGMSARAQHLGTEYRLKRVIPVAGRQGILLTVTIIMFPTPKFFISMISKVTLS